MPAPRSAVGPDALKSSASALLVHDGSSPQEWCVRIESPSDETTIVTVSGIGPLLAS